MGIQVQPNCCGGYTVGASHNGDGWYLYTANPVTGVLTKPILFQHTWSAYYQLSMGSVARHPKTKKLYAYNHALTYYSFLTPPGTTSYLYELTLDGIEHQIGPLKAPTGTYIYYEDGISNDGLCFSLDGNIIYGLSDSGTARRNASLMLVNPTTGAATKYAKNLGGDSVPLTDVSPSCFGLAIHPETKALHTIWSEDSPTYGWGLGTIDQVTGQLTKGPQLDVLQNGYPLDLVFEKQVNGDVWAYYTAYGRPKFKNASGFMRCKDVNAAIPVFDLEVAAVGMQQFPTGTSYLFGITEGH